MKPNDPSREAPVKTAEPLALDLLLTDDQRRPSAIEKQIDFQKSIESPDPRFDEVDEAAADPIHDHLPQEAPRHKVRGVLSILDQLAQETTNRRFAP